MFLDFLNAEYRTGDMAAAPSQNLTLGAPAGSDATDWVRVPRKNPPSLSLVESSMVILLRNQLSSKNAPPSSGWSANYLSTTAMAPIVNIPFDSPKIIQWINVLTKLTFHFFFMLNTHFV